MTTQDTSKCRKLIEQLAWCGITVILLLALGYQYWIIRSYGYEITTLRKKINLIVPMRKICVGNSSRWQAVSINELKKKVQELFRNRDISANGWQNIIDQNMKNLSA